VTSVEQLDLAVWPMLHAMTTRGLRVDQSALDALQRRAVDRMAAILAELESLVGHPVNPNSGVQVAAWMEEEGLTGQRTKDGSRLSTTERALKLHVSPVIDLTLEYRGLQKVVSSYIEPTRGYSRFDGRLHPRWKPTRVPSGRLACGRDRAGKEGYQPWDSPNLMAFPTRDEWGKALRACIVADPGYTMFSIDYSQIEMRNMAAASQDANLLRIYREERDIYTETAGALFGVPIPEEPDSEWKALYRTPAKVVTLAVGYGIGGQSLFEELLRWGCGTPDEPRFSRDEADSLISRWFAHYPGTVELKRRLCAEARAADGWATTELGRRRFLPALFYTGRRYPQSKMREEAERQVLNHWIQGTSQEDEKRAMVTLWPLAQTGRWEPLLQIHDELVGQTRNPDLVPELAAMIEFERAGVRIRTSHGTGSTWADLK
jgi:DNA polymerase-1